MNQPVDMRGRICLVTGANNGIGKETAVALARMGAALTMTSRHQARGEAALSEVKARSANEAVDLMLCDFASLSSIRSLASRFRERHDRLHVLVNNAGAFNATRSETEDGFETTFGVNHLGYFVLTNLLLDLLRAGAPSRIVNVSSRAHLGAAMEFADLNSQGKYRGMRAYARSKLANVLFTYELAKRLEGSGVTANCLHPGVVRTGFGKNNAGIVKLAFQAFQLVGRPWLKGPEEGAQTSIYLASSTEVEGVSGKYFANRREEPSSPASYDNETARKLWQISERLTGVHAPA